MQAIDAGIGKVHRDTFHADLGIGRYLLACTWYEALTGNKPEKEFAEFDIEVSESDLQILKSIK